MNCQLFDNSILSPNHKVAILLVGVYSNLQLSFKMSDDCFFQNDVKRANL